ncbi:hypothetical protein D3C84_1136420 [compost metagenome]
MIITHVADIELQLAIGIALAHVILLFLITAEYANFCNIRIEKTLEHRITKRAGAARNKKFFSTEHNES